MWTAELVGAGTRERDAGHHRGPTAPGAPCNHRAPRRARLDDSARCPRVCKKDECFAERELTTLSDSGNDRTVRLADLARDLDVDYRTLRSWVSRRFPRAASLRGAHRAGRAAGATSSYACAIPAIVWMRRPPWTGPRGVRVVVEPGALRATSRIGLQDPRGMVRAVIGRTEGRPSCDDAAVRRPGRRG